MSKTQFLAPDDYRKRIEQFSLEKDPQQVIHAVAQLAERRYPAAAAEGRYYLPDYALLCCYYQDQDSIRQTLQAVLGQPQSENHWKRLITLARYVYHQQHWQMLGQLAYQLDWALVADDADASSLGWQFYERLSSVLDASSGKLDAAEYLQVAMGYLHSLPESTAIPVDLMGYTVNADTSSSTKPTDWPVLRLIWTQRFNDWQQYPESIEKLNQSSHPFLAVLAKRMSQHKPQPAEQAEPVDEEIVLSEPETETDPFGDFGDEYVIQFRPAVVTPPPPPEPAPVAVVERDQESSTLMGKVKTIWPRAKRWWQSRNRPSKKVK